MANAGPTDGDIRATLALSQSEARMGSSRTLNLPGGRQVTVNIPAGVQNGEELRLQGQGEALWQGGPPGDLILTVSIPPVNPSSSPSNPGFYQNEPGSPYLATEIGSAPLYAAPASSPDYRPGSSSNIPPTSYSSYAPPPPPPLPPTQATYPTPAQSGDNYPYQQQQQGQEPVFLPQAQDQTSYTNPAPPVYPSYPQAAQPGGSGQYYPPPAAAADTARRRNMSSAIIGLIFVLILLLLLGSGLIYYFGVYQPKLQHDQATATANAQVSATAQANTQATASAVAQASATANAQASATANAQATANAVASATATALQGILTQAMSGTVLMDDSLTAPSNDNWDQLSPSQSTVNGSCVYTNGAYHSMMPTKGYFQPCYARGTPSGSLTFTTFAYQVQMTIVSGDEGGILFRANPNSSQFYLFRVNVNGGYDLFQYIDSNGKDAKDLLSGTASSFKTGLNSQNTITVVAQSGTLYFYINGQYVASASNSTFASGLVGVFGESNTNPTDVAFNNAKVWQI